MANPRENFDAATRALVKARDAQSERYMRAFKIIREIADKSYTKRARLITSISASAVEAMAHTLEATLVMAEDLPQDGTIALQVHHEELLSFVAYMRTLDAEYRRLERENEFLQVQLHERQEISKAHESEKDQGPAQSRAADDRRATIAKIGYPPEWDEFRDGPYETRFGDQRSENFQGNRALAEAERKRLARMRRGRC